MAAPEATLVRGLPRSNGGVPQVEMDHAPPLTRRGELFTPCFVCVGGLTTMFLYLLSFALIPTVVFAPFGIESFKTLDQYVFPGDIHFRAWKRNDGVWTILVTFNCLFLSPLLVVLCGVCILLLLVQAVLLFPLAICISLCIPLADEYEFWPEFWYSFPQALRFAWTSVMLVLFPFISPWSVVGSIPKARPEKQTARKWQPNYGAMYGSYYQRATWDAYADAGDAGVDEERMVGVKVGPTSGSVPLVAPDGTISAPNATVVGPADVADASASASASESAASGVGHVVMLPSGQLVPYADYAAALAATNGTAAAAAAAAATPLGQQGTRSIIQDYLTSTSVGSSVAGGSDVASEGVTTDEETEAVTPVRRARPAVATSSPLGLPVAQDAVGKDSDEEADDEDDEEEADDDDDEDDDEDDDDEDDDETEEEEEDDEATEDEDDDEAKEDSRAADGSRATEDDSDDADDAALSPTSTINSNGPW